MATHDYVIDNGTGSAVRADLNNLFKAILTNNSGTTDPSTVISSDAGSKAFSFWADTNSSPAVLKIRNAADDDWIELFQLDGTLTLEDGSNSAPALSFRSDLDTGVFRSAANTLDIATGGISRFQIDSSEITFNESGADTDFRVEGDTSTHLLFLDAGNNRVGIKASSPATPLHVGGTIHTTTNLAIRVTSSTNNLHVHQDDSDKSIAQFTNTTTGSASGDGFQIGLSSTEQALLNMKESASILFKTADSDAMTIDSSQRVGIGTTSPDELFHLSGNSSGAITGKIENTYSSDANRFAILELKSGVCSVRFHDQGDTLEGEIKYDSTDNFMSFATSGNQERARIDSSGRLLIGSTVNVSNGGIEGALQVIGTGSDDSSMNFARFSNDVNESFLCFSKSRSGSIGGNTIVQSGDRLGSIFFFGNDGTDSNSIAASIRCEVDGTPGANDMPGRLRFATTPDGSETAQTRMTIQNDGDVLIGTDSGVQNGRLEVRSDKTSASTVTFANTNGSYVGTVMLLHAERETVNNSYEFIGCRIESPNPGVQAFRLEVGDDGDVRNVNGSYGTISDISLKENIVDANSQWDDFKNLKFRSYNYKASTGFPTHKQIGVVAQEAETVCPNLVQTGREDENTKETHKFVKTSILYMKGMKALQEAIAKIEVLETKVAALEAG
tara:strand:+ start:60 stop:2069 length:2010 start_codon:yes stop_codon:yes gene_type:complete